MSPLLFYKAAFGACFFLLLVSYAALTAARKRGDHRQIRVLYFLRAGLSLSAVSYLLRVMGALHHDRVSAFSFITGLLGTLFLWLGWLEHWKLRQSGRLYARPAPRDEEDETVPEESPLLTLNAGGAPLTARAQRLLRHAQGEAWRRHECRVDTDHLLLGLLHDSGSAAAHLLELSGAGHEKVHLELLGHMAPRRKLTKPPRRAPGAAIRAGDEPLALTDRARQVLVLAAQEAHRFDRACIGTEHLLLGLVLMGKGEAAAVLFAEGVTVDGIRAEIIRAKKAA